MIIVDTGFWVVLFNNKDQYHQSAQDSLAQYSYEPLITTWCVLTETCHLLLKPSSNPYLRSRVLLIMHLQLLPIKLHPQIGFQFLVIRSKKVSQLLA